MQEELEAEGVDVRILGINHHAYEGGNETISDGRDIPWLQDYDDGESVWVSWEVIWRDVVILDRQNHRVTAFNLTENPLPASYETLKSLLRSTAGS